MNINIYLAPYLVNGDCEGLTDEEERRVDAYLAEVKGDLIRTDDEPQWARCEITGLWADCYTYEEIAR